MTLNKYSLKKGIGKWLWSIFRFVLLIGISFIILYPFLVKILASFMSPDDLLDPTVKLVPKNFSMYYWNFAWKNLDIANSGFLSLQLSVISGIIQVIVSAMVGYGLARFKFKGRNIAFIMVIVILLVPPQVYSIAQYLGFRYFGFGSVTVNLIDNVIPVYLLSFGCLSIKQGLYIYLMREFFKGLPRDLENAAYVDGSSIANTFLRIVLPNARSMMITIFLFAFCWQWTDTTFSTLYFSSKTTLAMRPVIESLMVIKSQVSSVDPFGTAIARGAATMIIISPVIILAMVCQKFLVQSISLSGLAN